MLAAVPLEIQSSRPCVLVMALNRREPLSWAKALGFELVRPEATSRTSEVPAGVPSVRQSSVPSEKEVAAK